MEQQEIINSWTLEAFCQVNGNPQFATLTNKQNGQQFNALMFKNGSKMVSFSEKLCNKSADSFSYVVDNKNSLNVIQLESGNYKLCDRPQNSWQDMQLF